MKVEVENIDKVRRRVEVILTEDKVHELEEAIYNELKKEAKVKGFRQGKVPRSVITNYYKDYIDDELKKRMIQTTMIDALSIAKVEPITEPFINFLEEGRYGYTLECEVLPEIELPEYRGIPVEIEPVNITDADVDNRIEGLRQMHAELILKEGVGAAKGDLVVIKYQGYANGKPLKEVVAESYPLELGTNTLMPEFENIIYGMKVNEEREIEITFPDDYPDKDIAQKTILFKVMLKEIREKRLPEVNDEFAKDVGFENIEDLKNGLRKEIEKEKERVKNQTIIQKIHQFLIQGIDIPVPKRLLERRLEMMVDEAKSRFKTDNLTPDEIGNLEQNLRREFEGRAEERIKVEIVLSKIAEKEGIKVEDSEVLERIKKIAEETKRSYQDIVDFYKRNNLMGRLKDVIVEEKTNTFLKENALIKEKA